MTKQPAITGKQLNEMWGVGAKHALYRDDGKWYHHLKAFPGVLFDANGYVIFETKQEYLNSPYLQIGHDLHVIDGISTMPNYIRISERSQVPSIGQSMRKVSERKKAYNARNVTIRPLGQDIVKRDLVQNERIIRDTKVSSGVKYIHEYKCQICGEALNIGANKIYAEAHHIKPLGNGHNGPDVVENVICVCPNHHALLDLGGIYIVQSQLRYIEGHEISSEYIIYHNTVIYTEMG